MELKLDQIKENGLYDPQFEHDNCGIGAIIDVKGRASHQLVADALSIVENLVVFRAYITIIPSASCFSRGVP